MNDDAAAAACEFSSLLTWADDDPVPLPSPLSFFFLLIMNVLVLYKFGR